MVIPKLPGSKLCLVTALSNRLHLVLGSNNDPLFATFKANKWSPLTDSTVRKHLKRVLLLLQLQHHNFTFHTFRRSEASWAFEPGVPIKVIKQQGTWSSDCIYYRKVIPPLLLLPKLSSYIYSLDGWFG